MEDDLAGLAQEPAVDFIETTPQVSNWSKLHPSGSNYTLMTVRIRAEVKKSKQTYKSWPEFYNVDLTEYYDYCKKSDINVLGHTVDFPGDRDKQQKCGISFYFASIKDKAHFILKFK